MKRLLLLAFLYVGAASAVRAQIPNNMAYQGYLTKSGAAFTGQAVLDIFMYDAPSGGTQIWSQSQTTVQVNQGYYSTMLDFSDGQHWSKGTQSFNKAYWLEVHIDGQAMAQRIQLSVSPYAFNSHIADSAIHIPQAPVGTIVAFGGDVLKLRNYEKQLGWYVCDGRRISRDTFPEYERMVGTTYGLSDNTDSLYLPDFRCLFLRGVDGGMTGPRSSNDSLRDPDVSTRGMMRDGANQGNKVGSIQGDAVGPHNHPMAVNVPVVQPPVATIGTVAYTGGGPLLGFSKTTDPGSQTAYPTVVGQSLGHESRPKNANVYWIIKVR